MTDPTLICRRIGHAWSRWCDRCLRCYEPKTVVPSHETPAGGEA